MSDITNSLTWKQIGEMANMAANNLAGGSVDFLPIILLLVMGFGLYTMFPGNLAIYLIGFFVLALGLYTNIMPAWLVYIAVIIFLAYSFIVLKERIFGS